MIQPNTGTLSNQRIGCLQAGQCDGGRIRLIPSGSRYTTTFRKLPIGAADEAQPQDDQPMGGVGRT